MKACSQKFERERARHSSGFTLVETMMGVAALALFIAACFSGIVFNRVASLKAKEEAIAMDYLIHYVETIKALQFNEVTGGYPINPLFNGSGGSPNITIPVSSSWVAINTTDFETFHPDLLWLHNSNPKMQVTLTTQSVGGVPHDKQLNVKVAWDSPLGHGGRLSVQLDLVRTKDL
jgi:type II secretory pathway pseudopilin PulG